MEIHESINKLAEEAIFLEAENLQGCGKMLTILETIYHPGIEREKEQLQGYLEAIIMNDLEGEAPEVEDVVGAVMQIQEKMRAGGASVSVDGGNGPGDGMAMGMESRPGRRQSGKWRMIIPKLPFRRKRHCRPTPAR